ncbi:VOC family protein [Ralstonia wenshanensis]|uniref:VOC family protein n=1 Tax=Ralstonia wenshanensis TaxID=2842456 RepID=UPI002AAE0B6A|nr:VOC family protein [Ralstonia wenshanensis]MDY7511236.1 VOC family protein [Ralstonia wenshanensis]
MNLPSPMQPLTIGIDHLGLTVRNLEASLTFFIECLGWKQIGGRPAYPAAFITDGHSVLTLWEIKRHAQRIEFDRQTNVGLHHVALRVARAEELDAIYSRVSQWPGVVVEFAPEEMGQGPQRHLMVYEPGGVRLELSARPEPTAD